jgi:hypothetical protein
MRKTYEEFVSQANLIHNSFYSYKKFRYVTNKTKGLITCPKHGDFEQNPNDHLQRRGCPKCKESKGEKAIREYLTKHKIKHTSQWRFKKSLIARYPFDFGVSHSNFTGVIEFQGEPHSVKCSFGGREKYHKQHNLKNYIKSDHKKLQWCIKNKVPILLIPYWNLDHIPEILDDVLAGRTPTFSEPPEKVLKNALLRQKIREHLGINEPEVLYGLIKPEVKGEVT